MVVERRCPWCGHRCKGRSCRYCQDLSAGYSRTGYRPFAVPPLDPHAHAERLPTLADELRQAVERR